MGLFLTLALRGATLLSLNLAVAKSSKVRDPLFAAIFKLTSLHLINAY